MGVSCATRRKAVLARATRRKAVPAHYQILFAAQLWRGFLFERIVAEKTQSNCWRRVSGAPTAPRDACNPSAHIWRRTRVSQSCSGFIDPLRNFSEACRAESESLHYKPPD